MKAIFEIIDFIKMKKSTGERQIVDKLYNLKNKRISSVSKKSKFNFDLDQVKFASPKELSIQRGPDGKRGENSVAGTDL